MGVFSYLSIKRPASFIWKAFSPSRELNEDKSESSNRDLSISGSDISADNKTEPFDVRRTSIDQVVVTALDRNEFAPFKPSSDVLEPLDTKTRALTSQTASKLQGQLFYAVTGWKELCSDVFANFSVIFTQMSLKSHPLR